MNSPRRRRLVRLFVVWLCLVLVASLVLSVWPAPARGDAGTVDAVDRSPSHALLTASYLRDVLGSRTRLIQVTTLAVCLGIFILSWSNRR